MKKALVVLAVLCFTVALSCASSGGGGGLAASDWKQELPGEISGNLGDFTTTNQPTQRGWCTDGTDGKETTLVIDDIIKAKFLVLQLSAPPAGGLQLIWQGDGDGWGWNQMDGVCLDDGTPNAAKGAVLDANNVLRIELSKAFTKFDSIKNCEQFKMFLGYYSENLASLGITKADLE